MHGVIIPSVGYSAVFLHTLSSTNPLAAALALTISALCLFMLVSFLTVRLIVGVKRIFSL